MTFHNYVVEMDDCQSQQHLVPLRTSRNQFLHLEAGICCRDKWLNFKNMSKSFNPAYILIKVQRPKCLLQPQHVEDLFAASMLSAENCMINKCKSIICLPKQRNSNEIWFPQEVLCHFIINMNT